METNPAPPSRRAHRPKPFAAVAGLIVVLLSREAGATEASPAVEVVPGHLYLARGVSFRNGDWVALEPAAVLLFRPPGPRRPVVLVARGVLGLGGSGGGLGLATSVAPPCPVPQACEATDFFWSGVAILEARVERTYGLTTWRNATYLGPQLTFSVSLLKASVGWMVDVDDRSDRHLQIGFGAGF